MKRVVETIWRDDFPRVTVAVDAPADVWTQTKNGLPGFARFRVFSCEGMTMENEPLYWRDGAASNIDATVTLDEAEPAFEGTVQSSGCCNFSAEELVHACDAAQLADLLQGLQRGHALALNAVGGSV